MYVWKAKRSWTHDHAYIAYETTGETKCAPFPRLLERFICHGKWLGGSIYCEGLERLLVCIMSKKRKFVQSHDRMTPGSARSWNGKSECSDNLSCKDAPTIQSVGFPPISATTMSGICGSPPRRDGPAGSPRSWRLRFPGVRGSIPGSVWSKSKLRRTSA